MTYKLEPESLTVKYILYFTKDLKDSTPVYNSCFNPNYTEEIVEKNRVQMLEPIEGIHFEDICFTADYTIGKNYTPITLKTLREIPEEQLTLLIERDVEDGFRYEYYESMVFNDDIVVLC